MKLINIQHKIFYQTDVWHLISHFMVSKSSIQYINQTIVWYSHTHLLTYNSVALRYFHILPLKH